MGADGAAYMTGYAFNENNREDYLTAKYDGSGNLIWTAAWNAPEGRSDIGYLVRAGNDNRVYVVGDAWRGFADYYDITSVVYRQDDPTEVGTPGSPITGHGDEGRVRLAVHPNPAREETVVDLYLPRPSEVSLTLYDAAGRLVRKLLKGQADAGALSLTWDGRSERGERVAPGIYLMHLTSGTEETVLRVTRLE